MKPFDEIEWNQRTAEITDDSGRVIFKQENVEVPKGWSILATKVVVSKYFYGVDYSSRDIRLGLVEASKNKIGTPVDQILLFCYHYDPKSGAYVLFATNVMRAGGLLTVALIAFFLIRMFRADRRRTEALKEGLA